MQLVLPVEMIDRLYHETYSRRAETLFHPEPRVCSAGSRAFPVRQIGNHCPSARLTNPDLNLETVFRQLASGRFLCQVLLDLGHCHAQLGKDHCLGHRCNMEPLNCVPLLAGKRSDLEMTVRLMALDGERGSSSCNPTFSVQRANVTAS